MIYQHSLPLLGLLIILGCSSCKHYLDIKPYGETVPQTTEEFSELLHYHLNSIEQGGDPDKIGNIASTSDRDLIADTFEPMLGNTSASTLPVYLGSAINTSAATYEGLYSDIRDYNIILADIPERESELAKNVIGTTHMLRAIAYYQLMRMYCQMPDPTQWDSQLGLPLVHEFNIEAQVSRSTLHELVNFIEADIDAAVSAHIQDPIFLFNDDIAQGYRARLYFWTGQWQKCLDICQEILVNRPLLSGENYLHMLTAGKASGNIIFRAGSSTATTSSETTRYESLKNRPLSRRFTMLFEGEENAKDIRKDLYFNRKRIATKPVFVGMRAAEFYLMAMECHLHLGNESKALSMLNTLRLARNEEAKEYTMQSLPTPPDEEVITEDATGKALTPLSYAILRERRKELFLEGDRFFELKRNGSPEFWIPFQGLKYINEKFMYVFPLPIGDNAVQKDLIQNPEYDKYTITINL